MHEAGIGGYFMHARGGLQTEYMGGKWFDNIKVGIDEGKKYNMSAWAYDENGWPSGFGSGIVNGMGIKCQQKYLRFKEGEKNTKQTIGNFGGYHFYYEINPFYVDTLDGEVIKVFIDEIYQPYYDKYKNEIEGFFTDEPQISRKGIPWSFILPKEYKKAYNDDLLPKLIELFKPVGDYRQTRFNFWKLVTDLFSKNYMKQIYDWCDSRGLKLTGHLVMEETMQNQLTSNGATMPHYEYFHIPGMDRLTRSMKDCLTMLQLCSVSHQLGKKQIYQDRNDIATLVPFLKDIESNLGNRYENIIADSGYKSEENYLHLERNEQKCYIKPQTYEQWKKKSFKNDISKRENMGYDAENDEYTCHNGKQLKPVGTTHRTSATGYRSEISVYEWIAAIVTVKKNARKRKEIEGCRFPKPS